MLEMAHREYGRLPWSRLFEPAMNLAEAGFVVSARLHDLIAADPELGQMAAARAYFFDAGGKPRAVGARLENPALDRKSTRLNSSHVKRSRMPSSA